MHAYIMKSMNKLTFSELSEVHNYVNMLLNFAHVSKQFGASNLNTNFISLYGALLQWRRSYSAFCKGLGFCFFRFFRYLHINSLPVGREG